MNEHLEHMVSHIARYAMMPHWVEEMRRWTLELQKEHPTVFDGLGASVASRIAYLKEQAKTGGSHEDRN